MSTGSHVPPRSPSPPPFRPGATPRTFFAVPLGAEARVRAAALRDRLAARPDTASLRWVAPQNYHVTLRFLGPTPPARIPALRAAVEREAAHLPVFTARLGPLCAFPSPRRPRVVALAIESEGGLEELAAALERGVCAAGFPPETRPFRAHLTLGRAAVPRPLAGCGERPPPAVFAVAGAVLFRSDPAPAGVHYTALEHIALGCPTPSSKPQRPTRRHRNGHQQEWGVAGHAARNPDPH